MLALCADHGARSLIVAHDGSIEALRRRRADVQRVVGLGLASEEALAVAVDKTRTLAFAEQFGLRAPRGCFVERHEQTDAAIEEVGLPLVVKPTRSWAQGAGSGQRLIAVVASTRAQAQSAAGAILDEGVEVVLQEWLPGDSRGAQLPLRAGARLGAVRAARRPNLPAARRQLGAARKHPAAGGRRTGRGAARASSSAWRATRRSSFAATPTVAPR